MAGVGHWRFDFATRHVTWSPQVYKIHGVSADTFDPNLSEAIAAYHPDDQPTLLALIAHAEETGEGYSFTLRLRRLSDGATRIVTAKAEVERDATGAHIALFGVFQDVTDREEAIDRISEALRQAEASRLEALRSEARLRALMENGSDVTMQSDVQGRLVYISPSVERISGYTPSEMIGKETLSFIEPEDARHVRDAVEMAIRTKGKTPLGRYQSRMKRKDGALIWLETAPALLLDPETQKIIGSTDVVRDITLRKNAEAAAAAALEEATRARDLARESESLYRLLADHASDIIVRAGPNGIIRYASPSASALGISAEDTVGRSTLDFVAPEDKAYARETIDALFAGDEPDRSRRREYRVTRPDGTVLWVEGNPSIVRDDMGTPTEFITQFRDVTARKALEEELRLARDAADAAARAKSDFIANLSHEFRTPLNSIIGFSGILTSSPSLTARERRFVDLIESAGAGLLHMVNDILDYSGIESGSVRLNLQPVEIAVVLHDAAERQSPEALAKGIALSLFVDPEAGPWLMADAARLHQILSNLLSNSLRFTDVGSVALSCAVTRCEADRQTLRLEVRDTGIGISATDLDVIFNRFAQAHNESRGGTGLGLTITKSLVEMMGGRIEIQSAPDVGTTAIVELELQRSPPMSKRESGFPNMAGAKRVLVVDDLDINGELISALLATHPHSVAHASNGAEAVNMVEHQLFDLILMDIRMPIMDGLVATQKIRQLPNGASVPIFALTAQVLPHQIAAMRAAGMDGHLAKPIAAGELYDVLSRCGVVARTTPPELHTLHDRFVRRTQEDLAVLKAQLGDATLASAPLVWDLVHRLAGAAGSFGFHDAGAAAAALDARHAAGQGVAASDFRPLLKALEAIAAGHSGSDPPLSL